MYSSHSVGLENHERAMQKKDGSFKCQLSVERSKVTEASQPYKCKVCDKTFRSKSGLKHHADTVHSSSSFRCAECGKTFGLKV